ncbi:hypothetical protein BDK51DRAFT_36673 [Blyttiomyces helicus]|uniref:Uncharacterized protein n=1 Tax=Blyttiomyces helicus TaxID=388810 RepID=A0A4P9W437_9FUNG|nr:hypothetical protein BDK51DRAFT_36673 [Blyttiomyces helicus]|eukprot:RKO86033.1 hypothetical protein BDK51DRAFT_36673 [Blyttiomyces helicus]
MFLISNLTRGLTDGRESDLKIWLEGPYGLHHGHGFRWYLGDDAQKARCQNLTPLLVVGVPSSEASVVNGGGRWAIIAIRFLLHVLMVRLSWLLVTYGESDDGFIERLGVQGGLLPNSHTSASPRVLRRRVRAGRQGVFGEIWRFDRDKEVHVRGGGDLLRKGRVFCQNLDGGWSLGHGWKAPQRPRCEIWTAKDNRRWGPEEAPRSGKQRELHGPALESRSQRDRVGRSANQALWGDVALLERGEAADVEFEAAAWFDDGQATPELERLQADWAPVDVEQRVVWHLHFSESGEQKKTGEQAKEDDAVARVALITATAPRLNMQLRHVCAFSWGTLRVHFRTPRNLKKSSISVERASTCHAKCSIATPLLSFCAGGRRSMLSGSSCPCRLPLALLETKGLRRAISRPNPPTCVNNPESAQAPGTSGCGEPNTYKYPVGLNLNRPPFSHSPLANSTMSKTFMTGLNAASSTSKPGNLTPAIEHHAHSDRTDDWTVPDDVKRHPFFVEIKTSFAEALKELDLKIRAGDPALELENAKVHIRTRRSRRSAGGERSSANLDAAGQLLELVSPPYLERHHGRDQPDRPSRT